MTEEIPITNPNKASPPGIFSGVSASHNNRAATASSPDLAAAQARITELETANARLMKLVGELLVANQRLRECGGASGQ